MQRQPRKRGRDGVTGNRQTVLESPEKNSPTEPENAASQSPQIDSRNDSIAPSTGPAATETPTNQPPSSETEVQCGICFENVCTQGEIDSCRHPFCFDCIHKW